MRFLLLGWLMLVPSLALDYGDYQPPRADRSPIHIEEVKISLSQREELTLLLVGLARNHGKGPLSSKEGAMALALANEIDPEQPALVQSWHEIPAGTYNPVHSGSNLEATLEILDQVASQLGSDKLTAPTRRFAGWIGDLSARCHARLEGQPAAPSQEPVDWTHFFPNWNPNPTPQAQLPLEIQPSPPAAAAPRVQQP